LSNNFQQDFNIEKPPFGGNLCSGVEKKVDISRQKGAWFGRGQAKIPLVLWPERQDYLIAICIHFNQSAFMRYFTRSVKQNRCFCVGKTDKAQIECAACGFFLWSFQDKIGLSAWIDLVWVCACFLHGAFDRRQNQ
jgi:hypothetical protein